MLNDGGMSDAMARVAAFLPWADLAATTRCCRATRDPESSAFYSAWAARSTLVLPPDSLVTHAILSAIPTVNSVVVPHSEWLELAMADDALAPRLARVWRVTLNQNHFQVEPEQVLDLRVLADAFPSTTHLTIERLEGIENIHQLSAFRRLKRLELSADEDNTACPISSADFPLLENLKVTNILLDTIQGKESLMNLRSLKVGGIDEDQDLSFLRHLPKLTKLNLAVMAVSRASLHHLVEIAPRLTRFECQTIESIWSSHSSVGGVDAERLARAFTKLQKLDFFDRNLHDLSSFSLITNLRKLNVGYLPTADTTPLLKLVNLEWLRLSYRESLDLAPLATLPRLVTLILYAVRHAPSCDTERVSFPRLQFFRGHNEALQSMKDLASLVSLTATCTPRAKLNLPLDAAPRLRKLDVSNCSDFSDLHLRFPQLCELSLTAYYQRSAATQILGHVTRLHHLDVLDLVECPDEIELDRFALLPKLRRLVLRRCNLTSLSGIQHLPMLRHLRLTWQKPISLDVSPLESLAFLHTFYVLNCRIDDVTPLTRIPSLQMASLPESVDCSPLVIAYHASRMKLAGAHELRKLHHKSNNCLWGSHYSERVKSQLEAMALCSSTASSQSTSTASL